METPFNMGAVEAVENPDLRGALTRMLTEVDRLDLHISELQRERDVLVMDLSNLSNFTNGGSDAYLGLKFSIRHAMQHQASTMSERMVNTDKAISLARLHRQQVIDRGRMLLN